MSGTSLDGIDVAAVATDGRRRVIPGPALTVAYPDAFRTSFVRCWAGREVAAVEAELTRLHAAAIAEFRARHPDVAIELVGFHGHTILHRPAERRTWQIGDGALLARLAGIDVVADSAAPMSAGGEGRPWRRSTTPPWPPIWQTGRRAQSRRRRQRHLIGPGLTHPGFRYRAGNALIDDWVWSHTGQTADFDGAGSRRQVSAEHVARFLAIPISSVRRRNRSTATISGGVPQAFRWPTARDLTEMTAARSRRRPPFPKPAARVAGVRRRPPQSGDHGGAHPASQVPVRPVEAVGWNGDALEAQAFAYLAVRSVLGLPLSLPSTTGAPHPVCGGRLFPAAA